jgi:predicted glycogen debranching enzyme
LYDVTNGAPPDPSIRPNQIFAVSLTYSMLSSERAKSVVQKVQEHLLKPYGLRTLARYSGGIARVTRQSTHEIRKTTRSLERYTGEPQ